MEELKERPLGKEQSWVENAKFKVHTVHKNNTRAAQPA